MELSAHFAQFFCKCETALKIKSNDNKNKESRLKTQVKVKNDVKCPIFEKEFAKILK